MTMTTTPSLTKPIAEELKYKRMGEIMQFFEGETDETLNSYKEEVTSGSLIEYLISSLLRLREKKRKESKSTNDIVVKEEVGG